MRQLSGVVAAALVLSGCASGPEREWQVAANPRATADEIIEAGHATGIATSEDQMVVTWEVEPEDDEGPYQGAWRLYDRDDGAVADGTFGTVREASAHIDVVTVDDGFLLTDYVKQKRHLLDSSGRLRPARLAKAKLGTSLAGGVLLERREDGGWDVLLPAERTIVSLTDLPTREVQGIELTSDGTVWVLLPWTSDGDTYRVAWAKDGTPPWTTETIPLPQGTGTYGEGFSASGNRLFVAAGRSKGERSTVDVILARTAGAKGTWTRIDATGIADNLTSLPRFTLVAGDTLVAMADGDRIWVPQRDGRGFTAPHLPGAGEGIRHQVSTAGRWLWSSEQGADNDLHHSHDFGKTWREFER